MKKSTLLLARIFLPVRAMLSIVWETMCFSGATPCFCRTWRSIGMVNTSHHTAVRTKENLVATMVGMPMRSPNWMSSSAMTSGIVEPPM